MISALLLGASLAAVPPGDTTSTSPADLAAYESARRTVGRGAEAQLKLALWCEAHGLKAERLRHLAAAVITDPTNATVRGLLGLVAYRGRWAPPNSVAEKVKADPELSAVMAEYNTRRATTRRTADAQWRLALWCEEKGLKAEATAHLTTVVRLDPGREAAWKRLGCKKHNGRWVTDAQLAAERAELEAQKQADKHWRPLLTKWSSWLGDKAKRAEAELGLASVTDPRAVPSVVAVFAIPSQKAAAQAVAVRVLGQIDSRASSRALAVLSLTGRTAEVRRAAVETLKRRDAREYADLLIALLRVPVKYEVRPVGGPGSPGVLFVEGKQFDVERIYASQRPVVGPVPYLPGMTLQTDWITGLPILAGPTALTPTQMVPISGLLTPAAFFQAFGADGKSLETQVQQQTASAMAPLASQGPGGMSAAQAIEQQAYNTVSSQVNAVRQQAVASLQNRPANPGTRFTVTAGRQLEYEVPIGQIMLQAQQAAAVSAAMAQQKLENDVSAIEQYNASVQDTNPRIAQVLKDTTGQDLGTDRKAWQDWWVDQLGYRTDLPDDDTKPTLVEEVPIPYVAPPTPTVQVTAGAIQLGFIRMSCFGAGTLVQTLAGSRAIERLRVGDQVLTQNTKTGVLAYQPILVVHHNPPSRTFRIVLGKETIVSSPFHRFWKVGRGWVMARDLKVGDEVRTLDGPMNVTANDTGSVQPVFNLDVAGDADFFVGQRGVLVHDNTLPDLRQAPFDTPPSLQALATAPVPRQD